MQIREHADTDSKKRVSEMLSLANRLRSCASICKDHIRTTKEAAAHVETIEKRNNILNAQMAEVLCAQTMLAESIKVGNDYLAEKRDASIRDVKAAIRTASTVIANCPELRLEVHANYAEILTGPAGREVPFDKIVGGGQRSTVSFFSRTSILNNTLFMPTMVLDESFSAMSSETSRNFSSLLHEVGRSFQVFIIEQKPEVTESGVEASFDFVLSGKTTQVKRTV